MDLLLWKRLTQTDFNGMHGTAKVATTGGGAMHVPLGVDTDRFPIKKFLPFSGSSGSFPVQAVSGGSGQLTFDGNPGRRGGEWRIADQFNHRHPAWTAKRAGFPTVYDPDDPPYIFVARIRDAYLAGHFLARTVGPETRDLIAGRAKGIDELIGKQARELNLPVNDDDFTAFEEVQEDEAIQADAEYDPDGQEDGRKRTMAEIVRRQGQAAFRKKLMAAYSETCAVSGSSVRPILEAAHISPYRGPQTNHVSNGLLLRADLHTLFDLGLIAVEPESFRVLLSHRLRATEYQRICRKTLLLPRKGSQRPSGAALEEHLLRFHK